MFVKTPKTNRKVFLNNNVSKYEKRLDILNNKIFNNEKDEIIPFCTDNACIKNKSQQDSYYKSQQILENLATYLLLGEYKENGIMTLYNIRQAQVKEIPASCSNSNAEDLIYSSDSSKLDDNNIAYTATKALNQIEAEKDKHEMSIKELNRKRDKQNKNRKSYKKSKTYKLNRLYSTPTTNTFRVKQQFIKDEEGKKTPVKNSYGQPVFDAEYMTIGGHKGLFDISENYISSWEYVDIHNNFNFNNNTYKISNKLKEYEVRNSSIETDDFENKSEMEKILCFYSIDKDKYYFFNENIDEITNHVRQE